MEPSPLVKALAMSCHPVPSVAVTALSAGLVALAGLPTGRGILVVGAVFTGQLSIGWSNDYLDAERDRVVHRSDKPVAAGAMAPRTAGVAAAVALILTVVLSATLGWRGCAAALVIVLCGWLYNLRLKATVLSWLPYAIAFGTLPAVATLSASPPRWPATWAIAAGALLGVAAHLANVLPDLGDDVATGVRGLPHRLGARATALTATTILVGVSAVILFGPGGDSVLWRWAGFLVAVLIAWTAMISAHQNPSSRRFFLATLLIITLNVLFVAMQSTRL